MYNIYPLVSLFLNLYLNDLISFLFTSVFVIALCGTESGGGELSDGGYWSCDHGNGSPAPSPPIAESDKSGHLDEGLDMEMDQMLFNEPKPRKRKVSR